MTEAEIKRLKEDVEALQKDAHNFHFQMRKQNSDISYDTAFHLFILTKIAQIQIRLREVSKEINNHIYP